MMHPLRYLLFLREIADDIAHTIAEANDKEPEDVFVVYYADLIGNLYWRKTFKPTEKQATMGIWSRAPDRYIVWHGWSGENCPEEINDEIMEQIEDDFDKLKTAMASED